MGRFIAMLPLLIEAVIRFISWLKSKDDQQTGRLLGALENQNIIEAKVKDAEIIRESADNLGNGLLKDPAERSAGRVQALQADLCQQCRGAAAHINEDSKPDKSAQRDLGEELFTPPKRAVDKVFIHCSASDRTEDDNVAMMDSWHKARGWVGIGYHFYIDKTGVIWKGRDIEKIPAAQQGHNIGSIAICCGGKSSFTVAQFLKLDEICRAINDAYSGKITFHGHCEVSNKTCPNFDYKNILRLDNAGRLTSCDNPH